VLGDDGLQRRIDILRHPRGVAAHVEVRALLEPGEQLGAVLAHPVLHVDLVGLIAREREIEPRQEAAVAHRGQFVAIVEVGLRMLFAEEQPVASARAARLPLVQEAAERRDAGAGADHHDRHVAVHRRPEVCGLLHEHRHAAVFRAIGEKRRGDAFACAPPVVIADGRHRQMNLARMRARARRDRVKPRLQPLQHADQFRARELDRKLVQHVRELLPPQPQIGRAHV